MNKYRNEKTEIDGIKFDSKREARYFIYLRAMQRAGKCIFERQVVFKLPGGIKYVADFVEQWHGAPRIVTDCKGFQTPVYRLKKKLMKNCLGIKINEV